MIPADHITINGDTALVVSKTTAEGAPYPTPFDLLNRPCDTCDGGAFDIDPRFNNGVCPDCDGSKRHTFEIEWVRAYDEPGTENKAGERVALRVYVIDVLPLVAIDNHNTIGHYIVQTQPSGRWWELDNTDFPIKQHGDSDITLPPDAVPGMWLVRLKVHQ